MDISLKIIKENEDGSADALVRFDKEGLEVLVQEGVLSILRAHIDRANKGLRKSAKKSKKVLPID